MACGDAIGCDASMDCGDSMRCAEAMACNDPMACADPKWCDAPMSCDDLMASDDPVACDGAVVCDGDGLPAPWPTTIECRRHGTPMALACIKAGGRATPPPQQPRSKGLMCAATRRPSPPVLS